MIKKILSLLILVIIAFVIPIFILIKANQPNNEDSVRQAEIQNDLKIINDKTKSDFQKPTVLKTVQISLTPTGFVPKEITVDKNTKVVWTNKSTKIATVDSNPHPFHTNNPELNLGSFDVGRKLEYIFINPGRYGYHNHFLHEEEGVIIVK